MILKDLIQYLEAEDPKKVVKYGFNNPHSYRGYYDRLAFEPEDNITVGEMLDCAKDALGRTYHGYKGGEFIMDEYTPTHLAYYGQTGEELGHLLLKLILAAEERSELKAENERLREAAENLLKCRNEKRISGGRQTWLNYQAAITKLKQVLELDT